MGVLHKQRTRSGSEIVYFEMRTAGLELEWKLEMPCMYMCK